MNDPNESSKPEAHPYPPESPPNGETGNGWAWGVDASAPEPSSHGGRGHECFELCPICRTADLLRGTAPGELRGQLDDVGREALLTLRAVADHYLKRMDARPAAGDRVEEIPID